MECHLYLFEDLKESMWIFCVIFQGPTEVKELVKISGKTNTQSPDEFTDEDKPIISVQSNLCCLVIKSVFGYARTMYAQFHATVLS